MSKRSSTSLRSFTLIEVLAGLMLLGTLLVSLILARHNLVEQQRRAQRTLIAVQLADALLAYWSAPAPAPAPAPGSTSTPEPANSFAIGFDRRTNHDSYSLGLVTIPREETGNVWHTLENDPIFAVLSSGHGDAASSRTNLADFWWQTRILIRQPSSDQWGDRFDIIHLEIYDRTPSSNSDPLVSVELVLPAKNKTLANGGSSS